MFYIGMVLYQQTAISTVANRTATNISQVYSNTLRDPFTGYVDPDNAYQSVTYGNMKTDAYFDAINQKGTAFAQYRLKKAQIIPAVDREVDVQVVNKPNEILKGQIVVNITDTYDVPLVGMFGLDGELAFTASGRADCVDYLEYLYGVEAVADPENSTIPSLPDSDTCVVTFVKDEYSGDFCAAVPVLRGKSIITSNRHSHSTMPSNPELNGMKFTGWIIGSGKNKGKSFSASTQVDESITVYGTWNCEITFDPTGGTVDPTKMTVKYKKAVKLPTPTKYSFDFVGWYSDVEYNKEYKSNNGTGTLYQSNVTEIPGNITLYAKWECNHAEYTDKQLNAGDCKTKSTWRHNCKFCNYTYDDRGGYGSHDYSETKITIDPSCTKTGWKIVCCKICDGSRDDGDEVSALGHKYKDSSKKAYDVTIPDRAATCTKTGLKNGSKCSRCGDEKGTIVDAKGHSLSSTLLSNGDCLTRSKWRESCKNCDYSCEKDGDFGSHNYSETKITTNPSCTTPGWKIVCCKVCDKAKDEGVKVAALDHKYKDSSKTAYDKKIPDRAATCMKTGLKNGSKCSRCGDEKGTVINKVSHDYSARCGETHKYFNSFTTYCTGIKSSHIWTSGFQCITCKYCGSFEPVKKTDNSNKYYKGYCKRRMIKNGNSWTYIYSSDTVWCVAHSKNRNVVIKQHYYGTDKGKKQVP